MGALIPAATTGTTTGTSNLYAVSSSGQLTPAVTSGSATIQQFFIAPNGDAYVVFASPANLGTADSPDYCLLAQVDPATNTPTCIDDTLTQINWPAPGTGANPPIQFDSSGRIYYIGRTSDGREVLRRYSGGNHADLITDNVELRDFLVLPNSTVFLTGQTTSTQAQWLRRLSPAGALQNVAGTPSDFLRLFPDGNVYTGLWDTDNWGVRRFLTATGTLDPSYWISDFINDSTGPWHYPAGAYCPQSGYAFCGFYGAYIKDSYTTSDGKVFVVTGPSNLADRLMQYYPTVQSPSSSVQNVRAGTQVGDTIALAGLNSSGQNILTLYNTSTGKETQLIGPDHEIEIYHLGYDSTKNAIVFDGLRFSDNTYIVGKVDLATHAVTVGATLSGQLQDLQTF